MSELNTLAVVGAGIGGLAAAFALGQSGFKHRLYEQADVFFETGAGIGLGPNAMRVLDRWGLGSELRHAGCTHLRFYSLGVQRTGAQRGDCLWVRTLLKNMVPLI